MHSLGLSRVSVLLLGALTSRLAAQSGAKDLLGGSSGGFVALSVASLDRLVPWYRDTLGFTVFSQGTGPNGGIRFALLQQGNALIEMLQFPDAKPRTEAEPGTTRPFQIHGVFKSGFVVADIDEVYRRIKEMGVPRAFELSKPPDGPYRTFGVRDPEGNVVQVFGR